MFKMFDGILVI